MSATPLPRRLLLLALALPALAGCETVLGPAAPPPRLYVLSAPVDAATGAAAPGPAIAVAPAAVPEHLDRAELVARVGAHELRPLDGDRWAERLPLAISRALAQELSRTLGRDVALRASGGQDALEVRLEIDAFEIGADGRAIVAARWAASDVQSRREIAAARFAAARQPAGPGAAAAVAAFAAAIGDLARAIAPALAEAPPPRRRR